MDLRDSMTGIVVKVQLSLSALGIQATQFFDSTTDTHMICKKLTAGLLLLWTIHCTVVRAEDPLQVLPDVERIQGVKTPAEFFGFAIGSRHLRHDQVLDYLHYLAGQSDRIELVEYGKTHGLRPLTVCVVSSADNIRNLEEIRKKRRLLTLGRPTRVDTQPLVMSMGYCVHGDEASAINAVPLLVYHLATAQDDFTVDFLSKSVAMIDPALNPDGTDRFANWANENRGMIASASPADREHHQSWPGGRTNYYWFDLNRDWLPAVHPESQGRLKMFHTWKPNVVLDFHEMGGNSSYFFQPGELNSNNPFSPAKNLELTKKFAAAHIEAMDGANELFYSEEKFDDFYVGKGSTYPDLQGAVGILFEQASTRGLRYKNDRVERHFRDTIANQLRLSLTSIEAAHQNRDEILHLQQQFFIDALNTASQHPVKAYLLHGTSSRLAAAKKMMRMHSIDCVHPSTDITLDGFKYPRQSVLLVDLAQPQHFLIRSLMEPAQDFKRNVFYDVSTWHLPSAMDLEAVEVKHDLPAAWLEKASTNEVQGDDAIATSTSSERTSSQVTDHGSASIVAWAIAPQELQTPQLVVALQQRGARWRVTTLPCSTDQAELPAGTFVLLKQANLKQWDALQVTLQKMAKQFSIETVAVKSTSTIHGPDFGSDSLIDIPRCQPLLLMGNGTSSYSAGSLWYYLDFKLRQPVDKVEVERLSSISLSRYSCILMPEGSYGTLSDSAAGLLGQYVQQGGTVIALGSSINILQRRKLIPNSEVSSTSATSSGEEPQAANTATSVSFADAEDHAALQLIAGAFLETSVDPTHPLAFGFPDAKVPVFRTTSRVFGVPSNPHQLIARYGDVIAGYVSPENRDKLRGTAAAWVHPSGEGRYILIADNPVFRGYVRGAEKLLVNALFIGPAFQLPSTGSIDDEQD